jgi:F-type H+-transporting ATPase subunit delta
MTPNPRLAFRYAKALLDLAVEKGQLDAVYNDMMTMRDIYRVSRELVILLQSPVIKTDKKGKILEAVTAGKISPLTTTFNKLLMSKEREAYLPEIATAFIEQYKTHQGIHTVKLTTAVPIGEELKQAILDKIKSDRHVAQVQLDTEVREDLIGGFILEIGDNRIDASVAFDLNMIKQQFQNNDFIYKIR